MRWMGDGGGDKRWRLAGGVDMVVMRLVRRMNNEDRSGQDTQCVNGKETV